MATDNINVKDIEAYSDGFNKGAELIETHKKLTSVNASFFKSLISREYRKSFYQGVADGWDYGFKKEKQKLQKQTKGKQMTFSERSKKREEEMQQMKKQTPTHEKNQER